MVRVVPINLAYNPRTLWFDPLDFDIHKDDPVIVETARGTEFGRVADEIFEAEESVIKALKSPLKPIKKAADHNDVVRADKLEKRGRDALDVFREMVKNCNLDMRPISVEFLFDGDKAVFYFEAEERVDFRDLVRKLASRFHIRVDMRQIGVRDEARIVGGIGHCGQELCCKRMGGNFNTVSIRMAKEQDLSLNPQSISGLCGRLMCCLRFEYDAYKDFKSRAPKINAQIETPAGSFKVTSLDIPREIVCLQDEDGKKVYVPLCGFEPSEKGQRPCAVGAHAWEQATAEIVSGYGSESLFSESSKAGDDSNLINAKGSTKTKKRNRKSRSGSSRTEEFSEFDNHDDSAGEDNHKTRRRRSTKIASGSTLESSNESSIRVGQKSSGLSRSAANNQSKASRNSHSGNNKSKRKRSQSSNNRSNNKKLQNEGKNKEPKKAPDVSHNADRSKQADHHRRKRSRTSKTSSSGGALKDSKKGESTQKHTSQKGNE